MLHPLSGPGSLIVKYSTPPRRFNVNLNPVFGCWNCIQVECIDDVSGTRNIINIYQIVFELHIRIGHLTIFPYFRGSEIFVALSFQIVIICAMTPCFTPMLLELTASVFGAEISRNNQNTLSPTIYNHENGSQNFL